MTASSFRAEHVIMVELKMNVVFNIECIRVYSSTVKTVKANTIFLN